MVRASATFNEFRNGGVKQVFVTEEDPKLYWRQWLYQANKAQIGTTTLH